VIQLIESPEIDLSEIQDRSRRAIPIGMELVVDVLVTYGTNI
jgi:hypothetical protein